MSIKKKNVVILLLVFAFSVILRSLLLQPIWYKIWGDELLYTDMARSFANDGTFKFANMYGPNGAYLYPLLLSVVFKFYDAETINITTRLLGVILMSSVVFPTYLLAKEMKYKQRSAYIFGIVSILLPDMLQSLFTVTEVIAYPLFMWTLYFFYKDCEDTKPNKNTVIFSLLVFLSYLTRSLNMAFFLAYFIYSLIIVWCSVKEKSSHSAKIQGIKLLIFSGIFISLYIIVPKILVAKDIIQNTENAAMSSGVSMLISGVVDNLFVNLVTWSYGVLWYLFFALIGFGIFTVLIPLTYKYDEIKNRRLNLFLGLLLISFIGAIVVLIHAVEEPITHVEKRVHFRYIFYFFIPYLLLLYKTEFQKIKWTIGTILGLGFVILFGGYEQYISAIRDTVGVESMALTVIKVLKRFITNYPNVETYFMFISGMIILLNVIIVLHKGWDRFLKYVFPVMLGSMILLNTIAYYKDIERISIVGNGGYFERNITIVRVLNQYEQGEVVLVAETLGFDNEIQTLQMLLEKCVDKLSIEEFDTLIDQQSGIICISGIERTPYIYATEQGHILSDAKCIGMRRIVADKYVISNKIIYEDDYFIIFELDEGYLYINNQEGEDE